jgi:hypothetical protein
MRGEARSKNLCMPFPPIHPAVFGDQFAWGKQ